MKIKKRKKRRLVSITNYKTVERVVSVAKNSVIYYAAREMLLFEGLRY